MPTQVNKNKFKEKTIIDSSAEGGDLLGKLVTPFLSIENKARSVVSA